MSKEFAEWIEDRFKDNDTANELLKKMAVPNHGMKAFSQQDGRDNMPAIEVFHFVQVGHEDFSEDHLKNWFVEKAVDFLNKSFPLEEMVHLYKEELALEMQARSKQERERVADIGNRVYAKTRGMIKGKNND